MKEETHMTKWLPSFMDGVIVGVVFSILAVAILESWLGLTWVVAK